MFNECHIHLCDCTCLNVFSHAQSWLIKHKKIFECFSCFWKVFGFFVFFFWVQKCQNFQKKQCCPVLVTQSQVDPVACPSCKPTQKFDSFCKKNGIKKEFLAPRTPQQNGVVEKKNRVIQEMARLLNKKIPQKQDR